MRKMNGYLMSILIVMSFVVGFEFAFGHSHKFSKRLRSGYVENDTRWEELSRRDANTGEEELLNTQDGKYYKIVDKREETQKEALEAGESGDVKIDRNEINSSEVVPMPDCSENSHRTQGIWYYVTDIKNDVNNPSGLYYPRSGNRFAIDCMMNVHTSGLFTGSANQWIYTPCHGPFSLSLEVLRFMEIVCLGVIKRFMFMIGLEMLIVITQVLN